MKPKTRTLLPVSLFTRAELATASHRNYSETISNIQFSLKEKVAGAASLRLSTVERCINEATYVFAASGIIRRSYMIREYSGALKRFRRLARRINLHAGAVGVPVRMEVSRRQTTRAGLYLKTTAEGIDATEQSMPILEVGFATVVESLRGFGDVLGAKVNLDHWDLFTLAEELRSRGVPEPRVVSEMRVTLNSLGETPTSVTGIQGNYQPNIESLINMVGDASVLMPACRIEAALLHTTELRKLVSVVIKRVENNDFQCEITDGVFSRDI